MSKRNATKYDEDALAMDIARGEMTYGQMAEKHGLSEVFVGQVARGERRPELQERIDAACEGMLRQAKRLGSRLASVAMARLGNLAAKESTAHDETQRKAAVDILKFAIGDPGKPETNVNQIQQPQCIRDFEDLPDDIRKAVAEASGGPTE